MNAQTTSLRAGSCAVHVSKRMKADMRVQAQKAEVQRLNKLIGHETQVMQTASYTAAQ